MHLFCGMLVGLKDTYYVHSNREAGLGRYDIELEPKDISQNAPKRTGVYKKSWATKKTKETSNSLVMTVHSKNRYQIAHLLEHGHAKRGGGRVAAIPHIEPAEAAGASLLQQKIERGLRS